MSPKEALDNVIRFYNQTHLNLTGHHTKLLEMSFMILNEVINPPPVKPEEKKEPGNE